MRVRLLTVCCTLAFCLLIAGPAAALERPVIAGELTQGSALALVHYPPGYDARATAALNHAQDYLSRFTAATGLRAPLSDGTMGGDSRFDVYLLDESGGNYAYWDA